MENAIQDSAEISKRSNTAISAVKGLYKATKFVFVVGLCFGSIELAKHGYRDGERRFIAAKESFVTSEVAKSLQGKTFKFNHEKGTAIPASVMTREQLLFALYGAEMARRSAEATLADIGVTLGYGREGDTQELLDTPGS